MNRRYFLSLILMLSMSACSTSKPEVQPASQTIQHTPAQPEHNTQRPQKKNEVDKNKQTYRAMVAQLAPSEAKADGSYYANARIAGRGANLLMEKCYMPPYPSTPRPIESTEEYDRIEEGGYREAIKNPLST